MHSPLKISTNFVLQGVFTLAILGACRPEPLSIEIPQLEPKVVVASQIVPPDILLVSLSKSFSALTDIEEDSTGEALSQLFIRGASVGLEYDGRQDSLIEVENGFYIGLDIDALPGRTYRLSIQDTGGLSATAEASFLAAMTFDSIVPTLERGDDTLVEIEYTLRDLPGDNWYMLNFYSNLGNEDSTFNIGSILGGENVNGFLGTELISDDEFAADGSFKESVTFFGLQDTNLVAVSISNISEEYYNYLVLRERAGNIFSQIVSEPINYPTNVEGGLGFFTLHFPQFEFFDLNDY